MHLESQFGEWAVDGLLSEDAIRSAVKSLPSAARPRDRARMAEWLIKQGLLTPFQVAEIDAGRRGSLVLGNYVVLDRIGAGGMGLVLKARHCRMDRLVALKVLPTSVTASPERLARFQREVKAAARLEHPNIVAAYDADECRGVHYLAMQYVDGNDLATLVKRDGPFELARSLDSILQVARGLGYAHGRGVIHRDIKPSNLLMDGAGRVRILDLGLARILNPSNLLPETELTSEGAAMGTADYMAPEQSLDAGEADARSDIYSLGCTWHYLLTGRAVYGGDSVIKRVLAHRDHPVPKLGDRVSGIPPELEAIFQRMLAKNPGDRFPSITCLLDALQETGAVVSADATGIGPGTQERMIREERTRSFATPVPGLVPQPRFTTRRMWLLVAAISVITTIATVGYVTSRPEPRPHARIAKSNSTDAASSPEAAQAVPLEESRSAPAPASPPEPATAPFDAATAADIQRRWAKYLNLPVEYVNDLGMSFRLIPPGLFDMGSTPEEIEDALRQIPPFESHWRSCVRSEGPRLRVGIDEPFYMATYQTTQSEYMAAVGRNPSDYSSSGPRARLVAGWTTDRFPVDCVSWNDAVSFANRVNEIEGLPVTYRATGSTFERIPSIGYRLPAEAEWEYAVRAGTTTRYWNGDAEHRLREIARFSGNHTGRTHAVGELAPNPWGLFDTYGNVWAWCEETWVPPGDAVSGPVAASPDNAFKVIRGGYWNCSHLDCRSAAKGAHRTTDRNCALGCRLVVSARAIKQKLEQEASR